MPYGDADALAAAVTDETAAVVLEPVQGEAGVVHPARGLPGARPGDHRARTARCCGSTRCRPGWGAPASWFAHSGSGRDPGPGHPRQGAGRRHPRSVPASGSARAGDAAAAGQPRHHLRRQPGRGRGRARGDRDDREGRAARQRPRGRRPPGRRARARARHRGAPAGACWSGSTSTPRWPPQVVAAAQERGFILNACAPDRIRLAPPLVLTGRAGRRAASRPGRRSSTPAYAAASEAS